MSCECVGIQEVVKWKAGVELVSETTITVCTIKENLRRYVLHENCSDITVIIINFMWKEYQLFISE